MYLGNPLPSSNQYLYDNICSFLSFPEFKIALQRWLAKNDKEYEQVLFYLHKQTTSNHLINNLEHSIQQCNSEEKAHKIVKEELINELLKVSSITAQINPLLLQIHTFLLMISNISNKTLSSDWVMMIRKGKGSFMNDPRFQRLNIHGME